MTALRNTLLIALVAAALLMVVAPVGPDVRSRLLSLFAIVLAAAIALSATTFVGNTMAGIVLKTVRTVRPGDFVQVGDHFGRVTARHLLSIEIQTEDRDLVTLPNLLLVNHPVKVVRSTGTIVSADVALGYDVPHARIEELLLPAAADAGLDEPVVLVMDLGAVAVTYRIAGLLTEVEQLWTVRSRLRVAALDRLHGGGIAIVSPNHLVPSPPAPGGRMIPPPVAVRGEAKPDLPAATVAGDEAEAAETIEQLQHAHAKTRAAIARLADPPDDLDRDEVKRQQERLARRLARIERIIAARQAATESPAD